MSARTLCSVSLQLCVCEFVEFVVSVLGSLCLGFCVSLYEFEVVLLSLRRLFCGIP